LNPEEALPHADTVVIGEAERTWPELVSDFKKGQLKRMYAAKDLADLNSSPRPRRDLLRQEDYQIFQVVEASKGCPYGCEFCSLYCYVGHRLRFRSIENVIQEIQGLPGDRILFADDNLYSSPAFTKRLLEALIPTKKRWVAEATWHMAFDKEVLNLAKQSGCAGLFVGFDSINQQWKMKKVPDSKKVEGVYIQAIQNIQKKGIAVVAAFVFGLDNDDTSVFERSLRVVLKGGANLVNFSALVPYPGTPIFHRLKREGRIIEWDWSKYISPHVCFEPQKMTVKELREGILWAQKEFYSLRNIVKISLKASWQFGWAIGLLSLNLNLSQKRNWGKGSD
jgi:radical SAM superfamily enzyme YgiQ (UPF0313 family)